MNLPFAVHPLRGAPPRQAFIQCPLGIEHTYTVMGLDILPDHMLYEPGLPALAWPNDVEMRGPFFWRHLH